MRKSLLLAAVLALVPTAALAATEWEANSRRCTIDRWYTKGEDAFDFDAEGRVLVVIKPEEIASLEREIALLKHCSKFWSCVKRRDTGKVKHCYLPK
jgi:hypothetical protein